MVLSRQGEVVLPEKSRHDRYGEKSVLFLRGSVAVFSSESTSCFSLTAIELKKNVYLVLGYKLLNSV